CRAVRRGHACRFGRRHRAGVGGVPPAANRDGRRRRRSAPMSTVGVLGGGQLARLLALAGVPLGLRLQVHDPAAHPCAGHVAPLLGGYDDRAVLDELAGRVDVATFDFENVPADAAEYLAASVDVLPTPAALAAAQDRLVEKTLFHSLGIPVPAFEDVTSRESLDAAIASVGAPCILKTRRLGYDGKGQFRIREAADADAA